jgi:iron-sulfur cluster repair protein YtfE (RIC family)
MRHANLIPLTHDHHHALAACRRLRLAAEESEAARVQGAGAFLEFFETDGVTHFREEEELLFPLIVDEADAQETLSRVMIEHLRLHAAVKELSDATATAAPPSGSMTRVAALLESHIRFEEKVVFPLIEHMAGEEGLKHLFHAFQ